MCQLRGLLTFLPAPAQVSLTFFVALRRLRRERSRPGPCLLANRQRDFYFRGGPPDPPVFEVMSSGYIGDVSHGGPLRRRRSTPGLFAACRSIGR